MPMDFNSGFVLLRYDFGQAQVAASQTAVELFIHGAKVVDGTSLVKYHVMPTKGSIIAMTASLSAAGTAGTITVTPTIGGTALTTPTGLVAKSLRSTTLTAFGTALVAGQTPGAAFAALAKLGVKLTTNGSWDGTTSDLLVSVYVLFEDWKP